VTRADESVVYVGVNGVQLRRVDRRLEACSGADQSHHDTHWSLLHSKMVRFSDTLRTSY